MYREGMAWPACNKNFLQLSKAKREIERERDMIAIESIQRIQIQSINLVRALK